MKEASPLSHNSSALLGTPSKVGLRQGLACEQRVMPYPPPAQGQVTRAQEAEENYVIKRELAVVRQQCSSATEDLQKAQSTIRQLQEQQVPAGHRGEATLQPPAWQPLSGLTSNCLGISPAVPNWLGGESTPSSVHTLPHTHPQQSAPDPRENPAVPMFHHPRGCLAGPSSWHRHSTLTDGPVVPWCLPKVFGAIGLPQGSTMKGRS